MKYFTKKSSTCLALAVSALLVGCEDGSDFGPGGGDITIEINNPAPVAPPSGGGVGGGTGTVAGRAIGPGLVDNPNDPIPVGATIGLVASDDGASATPAPPPPAAAVQDPWEIADFWAGINADPPLNNTTNVRGLIDSSGMPIGNPNVLRKSFDAPSMWPPESASDATRLPVPSYIGDTSYVGAYEPGVPRSQQWTAGWTVGIEGNKGLWKFHGGEPGTALANVNAPVSDGTCPQGTSFAGAFSELIGSLQNDAAGLFSGSAAEGDYDVCTLQGRYDTNNSTITLTNDNVYNIADSFPGTKIGNGDDTTGSDPGAVVDVTLVIEAGTLIYGEPQEALIATRGSKVNINGTRTAPVVMTSLRQLDLRFDGDASTIDGGQQGEWAGFALMGYARDHQCGASFIGCNVLAEGGIGNYGGNDDEDSSGNVNYLVIRHAGNDLDGQGNELNGFTLFGVGRNTELQYVQIHRGFDDGIEFFGGNAFIRYLVLTGNGDDSLDYDNGWTGGAQNVLIIQESVPRSNHGIEADSRFAQTPITFELVSNITILGPETRPASNPRGSNSGILFREGKRGQIHNAIITGDFGSCFNINDNDTFNRADEAGGAAPNIPGPHFFFRNSIVDCIGGPNFGQQ